MVDQPRGSWEFRRQPHLVLYWRQDRLELHNYALNRTIRAPIFLLEVLEQFQSWRRLDAYLESAPGPVRPVLRRLVLELYRKRFLIRRGEPVSKAEQGLTAWGNWNPAAGFFHGRTRNNRLVDVHTVIASVERRRQIEVEPPKTKRYGVANRIALPPPRLLGTFPAVLRHRRTWRTFGRAPVSRGALATLLQLSFGVQSWVNARGEGRVPLKTSPSGGARHPVEAYVVVRNVSSIRPGIYHYAADDHALEPLGAVGRVPAFDVFLPTQSWYRPASLLVFFTAVFGRTQWRYQSPRSYRAVMLEVGHVCQTFCLTATWLGLAPFCSLAIDDRAIERLLRIDGVSESVLYAAGVGTRPKLHNGQRPGSFPGQLALTHGAEHGRSRRRR